MGGPRDFYCLVRRRYARPSFCFFPHDSHTMRISSSFTAKSCAVCSSANLREKSGSVPCEETITATRSAEKIDNRFVQAIFHCLVSRQILSHCGAPNLRGQVPAFSRVTATQCVYQALLQQNPVQYARRPTCGKNRDRFRVKKPLQPHTWHIKLFTAKSCAECSSTVLPKKSGSVPCEETILFVNVAAIVAKMSGFPCVVSAAKKIWNGSVYSNEFCVPGKPINPNFLRRTYAAKAARIQQLREYSAVFP